MDRHPVNSTSQPVPPSRSEVRLAGLLQQIYPKHLLSWMMLHATRCRFGPWKNWQVRWFTRRYGVDVSVIADSSPEAYRHFNAFFTRELIPGARPLEGGPGTVVSPADGTVAAAGVIEGRNVVQAKGRTYGLGALFGRDERAAAEFEGGRFATIYLAPRDYHRVHMPVTGRLRSMVYVPGRAVQREPGHRECDRRPVRAQRSGSYRSSIPTSGRWRSPWSAQSSWDASSRRGTEW